MRLTSPGLKALVGVGWVLTVAFTVAWLGERRLDGNLDRQVRLLRPVVAEHQPAVVPSAEGHETFPVLWVRDGRCITDLTFMHEELNQSSDRLVHGTRRNWRPMHHTLWTAREGSSSTWIERGQLSQHLQLMAVVKDVIDTDHGDRAPIAVLADGSETLATLTQVVRETQDVRLSYRLGAVSPTGKLASWRAPKMCGGGAMLRYPPGSVHVIDPYDSARSSGPSCTQPDCLDTTTVVLASQGEPGWLCLELSSRTTFGEAATLLSHAESLGWTPEVVVRTPDRNDDAQ